MEGHLIASQNLRNWKSNAFGYSRNVFAIIGLLAVLGQVQVLGLAGYSEE